VSGDVVHRGAPGRVGGAVDEFVFEGDEERFGNRSAVVDLDMPA